MRLYPVERSLSRSKSRRWRQIRKSSIYLILAVLALFTWAWVSLVFAPTNSCYHTHQVLQSSSTIFPWDLVELNEQMNTTLAAETWHANSLNATHDLSMNQILFGIAGAAKLWPRRKEYVKLWWSPRKMRGFVWLEDSVEENPEEGLPVVKVSEDISRFSYTNPTGHPSGIRIARIIKEAINQGLPDVKWFVMGDDDTVFAAENLLQLLRKYDSNELYYIGNPSESHSSNTYFSHGMSFGGGGIAISYPLAKMLSGMLDDCIERYPFLFGSDDRLHACITELGVPLTKEPGFHQLDIHGNAFGFLAAHPIAPFISMHHLDEIGPVIPQYSALDGLHHLIKAMRTEPSTFLQRCICYTPNKRLTFSVSLGYAIQVYPFIVLPRDLERAEITFRAWNKKAGGGEFNFDTRTAVKSVCKRPFLFFLDRIDREGSKVVSIYKRDTTVDSHKRWFFCFFSTSLEKKVQQIRVVSKPLDLHWFKVPRRQCCKVTSVQDEELAIYVNSCQIKERRL
ncbi:hypothetical protein L7F22_014477 [Adiantum nelumboides]|nr:hypothetical protein [Adiantum nelumboides]